MGLDMYLNKRSYIGNQYRDPEKQVKIIVPENQEGVLFPSKGIKTERVSYIIEQVGYWRKANQIHRWFVDNVQNGEDDCGEYYVPFEKLEELLKLCEKVKNKELIAEETLPTQSGFFFGNLEYDEYYMQDIDDTINIIKPLLEEKNGDFYYTSSW